MILKPKPRERESEDAGIVPLKGKLGMWCLINVGVFKNPVVKKYCPRYPKDKEKQ